MYSKHIHTFYKIPDIRRIRNPNISNCKETAAFPHAMAKDAASVG